MYTRPEIERILKVGFEYAMKRNKHLTVVDKANVLASSRLWRQIADVYKRQIASGFHLFPFRTEKLSLITPMVLRKVGE